MVTKNPYFMKYAISLACLILISGCNNSSRIPLKRVDYQVGFEPGVKSIKEYDCQQYWTDKIPPQIVKSSCSLSKLDEYTKEGHLTKELIWFDSDNQSNPESIRLIKYNDSGQIIEDFSKSTGIINTESKIIYSYNASGFQTERIIFLNGKITFREEDIYDEFNCPIKKIYYKDNLLNQSITYEYDTKNRPITEITYDENSKLMYKEKYAYESGNKYVKYIRYDSEGKIIMEEDKNKSVERNKINGLYTNALPGKEAKNVEYFSNGKVRSWHFKNQNNDDVFQVYDDNERIIERKIYSNEKWQDTFTWKYREDGAILEESESTSRIVEIPYFKKTTYYKYDIKGYWIEKVVVDTEGRAIELKAREIDYYVN